MSYEDQRELYRQLRADQQIVGQAAEHLRHGAIRAAHAGMERKELAFALALILDELARHLRDLDEQRSAVRDDLQVGFDPLTIVTSAVVSVAVAYGTASAKAGRDE